MTLAYSPCPNDTYIMAALERGRVKSDLDLRHALADVETLNKLAMERRHEVTKLSFAALGTVREDYGLLNSGGAMGWGCGPLLVAREGAKLDNLRNGTVAAPGSMTTACLLLSLFCGRSPSFKHMVFSDVMPAVTRGDADFGLVIHEGRFTIGDYGLASLLDLGQWWETETGLPIPLGAIAMRRDLGPEVAMRVDSAIKQSLEIANADPASAMPYVRAHAQEMDEDVMRSHIGLYVNEFSLDLSEKGRHAVETLFSRAERVGLIQASNTPVTAY